MPNMICAVKFKKRFDDRLISDTNMFNKLKEKENQLPITMFLKKKTSRQLLNGTKYQCQSQFSFGLCKH